MENNGVGCLYVVGVGPGDPELLTLKAARILAQVPVIFVPQKDGESEGYARRTIAGLLKESQTVIPLLFPMLRDKARLEECWRTAVESICAQLSEGKDCAFVNIGDPLLYGTAIHILETLHKLHPDIQAEVVPGISSISAAAAAAQISLGIGNERIAVLSGNCEDREITETLQRFETVVFLKVNVIFERLLGILEGMGLVDKCVCVSKGTTAEQILVRDVNRLRGKKLDYLSLLIVRR